MNITVKILDTKTGDTRTDSSHDAFYWTDGNGDCDCNRMTLFGLDYGPDNLCVGCHRFLIVDHDSPDHKLSDFNTGYPDEMIETMNTPDPMPAPHTADAVPALTVTLEPDYDAALIGNTVHPEHASRAVYSLNTLARIRSRQGNRSIESAQEDVKGMVMSVIAQHGDRAPLFVDDVIRLAVPKKQKSRIILPGMARFNPGNH